MKPDKEKIIKKLKENPEGFTVSELSKKIPYRSFYRKRKSQEESDICR